MFCETSVTVTIKRTNTQFWSTQCYFLKILTSDMCILHVLIWTTGSERPEYVLFTLSSSHCTCRMSQLWSLSSATESGCNKRHNQVASTVSFAAALCLLRCRPATELAELSNWKPAYSSDCHHWYWSYSQVAHSCRVTYKRSTHINTGDCHGS